MGEREKFYPSEENLGKECSFWDFEGRYTGCNFPNAKTEGRTSCEGIVDDVCLLLKDGRPALSLTKAQLLELMTRIPGFGQKPYIPPGDIQR